MSLLSKPSATLVLMVLATCVVTSRLFAQSRTEILAQSGQAAPDNNGFYSDFGAPALNDSGQAAFVATLAGTSGGTSDNTGVFRGSEKLAEVVKTFVASKKPKKTHESVDGFR